MIEEWRPTPAKHNTKRAAFPTEAQRKAQQKYIQAMCRTAPLLANELAQRWQCDGCQNDESTK